MGRLSQLANTLIPSEIIKLGNEINERIKQGQSIYNFTIGDFDPSVFPIPAALEEEIILAYQNKKTNYPPANGIAELRNVLSGFIQSKQGLSYSADQFLISGGGRPLIYAAYRVICDEGDKIIYPVPSWNNNHYTHFVDGEHICIEAKAENNFLPTAEELIPHMKGATLLALCSPLNPTGTVFTKPQLKSICEAVIAENKTRSADEKPLFILYDQIYWTLTFGDTQHFDPVSLFPELKEYTIFIDGISKSFCATGVRVGWAFGPSDIIDRMKAVLSHVGAWSPMAEQVATARFLKRTEEVDAFLIQNRNEIHQRLDLIFKGIMALQSEGYPVDAIAPMAAMYLTIRFSLKGLKHGEQKIEKSSDISQFLLEEAHLAIVPFSAFGADRESDWFRLSVGTCSIQAIPAMLSTLKSALQKLQ